MGRLERGGGRNSQVGAKHTMSGRLTSVRWWLRFDPGRKAVFREGEIPHEWSAQVAARVEFRPPGFLWQIG
jgi:hypothetical protein